MAKSLFSQARLAYRNGDYEEAILKWQESFSLSQEPLILESIANAYEKLGDRKRALENLENWRKAAPKNEQKALDDRIVLLRERVKADGAEEQLRKDAERRVAEEAARTERLAEAERRRTDEEKRESDTDGVEVAGWTLTGVGAALVVGGVVFDLLGSSQRPDASAACRALGESLFCHEDERDAIEQSNMLVLAGDIGWIAGAAMAVTGSLLLVLDGTAEHARPPATAAGSDDAKPAPPALPDAGEAGDSDGGDDDDGRLNWRRSAARGTTTVTPLVTPTVAGVSLRVSF